MAIAQIDLFVNKRLLVSTDSIAKENSMDVAQLAELLHETAEHHDPYEKTHPPHNWWDWYAAYMNAREQGSDPEQASEAAGHYMEDVIHLAS
jgi:hypothetical protein